MSLFFINRPVFAWVIAIIIMLIGVLSIRNLPVEQYPNISSPSVAINTAYPGASAQILENSVTQIIEQRLTGIDNMRYFSSSSDSAGYVTINVVFEPGTDPDIAQIQVQNKVQGAIALLPQEVQNLGVTVTKNNSAFLLVAGFYSEDNNITQTDLGDLLNSKIRDGVARVSGVGNVVVFGEPKAMRIWLNPHKMHEFNLTIAEIKNALKIQNSDVSAGQLGGLPAVEGQQLNVTISTQSKLKSVDDFKNIILRVNQDGGQVRIKDIAKVELGSESYEWIVRYKKKPAAGLAISLATGANALKVSNDVKEKISELIKFLPKNVKLIYPYDNTPFIKLAIKDVVMTLLEAIVLVFIVMFLFLQNIRATLIPTIAVPVVLLGTFAMLYMFGFTINVLTMFAMVLAIGLLVDDAIVVVENVERVMREENISPKEATKKSMKQITGALIGIALVLSAVFVPMIFFSGSAGVIYKQFSVTIASAMGLSVLVALILSPSLCATLLKPTDHAQSNFFKKFNSAFDSSRNKFLYIANNIILKFKRYFLVYLVLIGGLGFLFLRLPTAFLPNEDQGVMYLMLNTPPGSTIEKTLEKVKQVENYFLDKETDTIEHIFTVTGFSFTGKAQNVALGFVGLKDWKERKSAEQSVFNLANRAMAYFSKIKDSLVFAFYPPPIPELGNASGFDLQLIDRNNLGHEKLMQSRNHLLGMASQNNKLQAVRPNGLGDVPQFKITVDHEKASALGLDIADINDTLQTAWGSEYINNFLDQGRVKRVYIQAGAPYRMVPDDMKNWYIKNRNSKMVPLDSIISFKWSYGSPKLERYNGSSSINIQGSSPQGVSTGESMKEMEKLISKLPYNIDYEWSGLSYEEKLNSQQTTKLYGMSLLVIFLCLAALYESWSVPFSVMLTVPLGIIGVIIAALAFKLNNDVYFQVALLTTIGLTAKNAILIVEFAKSLNEKGMELKQAAITAAKLRFRPIIMTSMAFVLGVMPLAVTSGVGSASQNAIGLSVIGGMLSATFIATLFVPMLFIFIRRLF